MIRYAVIVLMLYVTKANPSCAPNPYGSPDGGADATDGGDGQPAPSFSFVVFGDNQFDPNQCFLGTPRMAVPKVILDLNPDFVLTTGDNLDDGGPYSTLKECYSDMLASLPFFPTAGNHDCVGISDYQSYLVEQLLVTNPAVWGSAYNQEVSLFYNEGDPDLSTTPSGFSYGTYYAFKYQNSYFISFEVGTRYWTNTPKSWVEHHLGQARSDPTIEHIFVYLHHPIYSTTMVYYYPGGEYTQSVQEAYEDLFQQYHVTMVFSGHAHLFEHFVVPDDATSTRQIPPAQSYAYRRDAVHYIVTGGGGASLNSCTEAEQIPGKNYSQGRFCSHHVTQVRVEGGSLEVNVMGVSGNESNYTTTLLGNFVIQ